MTSKPEVFIFIGKSGSGKGTQVDLLMKFLKKQSPDKEIVYLQTGQQFRDFIAGDNYSQKLAKTITDEGGLQPEFLAINMWSSFFVKNIKPNIFVVIDGTPRKFQEAATLDSAIGFYGWNRPRVIYLDVSHGSATQRLLKRGRNDDKIEAIKSRLNWFDTDVVKAVDFYRENSGYVFLDIDGEQTIEKVHQDILQKLGFMN